MLCEICEERKATIHLSQIDGEVVNHSHFCDACFEASNPAAGHGLRAVWPAGCKYCGGDPAIGGLHALGGAWVMCERCADEFYRFLDQKWPGFVECARTATVTPELIAGIQGTDRAAVIREAEEHMRKSIANRSAE